MDNFFTGAKDNIKHLIGKPNFEVIRHDVVEPILLEVDQIYHLACPASPIHYKYVRCLVLTVLFSALLSPAFGVVDKRIFSGTTPSKRSKRASWAR